MKITIFKNGGILDKVNFITADLRTIHQRHFTHELSVSTQFDGVNRVNRSLGKVIKSHFDLVSEDCEENNYTLGKTITTDEGVSWDQFKITDFEFSHLVIAGNRFIANYKLVLEKLESGQF